MKKAIILGLVVGFLALAFAGSADASHYGGTYYRGGSHFSYDYNSYYNDAVVCMSFHDNCGYESRRHENREKKRAVKWLVNSYDARYNYAGGWSSGAVFSPNQYDGERENSAWRFKPAYDYRDYQYVYGDNYYYEPRYNSEKGYWAWR